ncbi:adhesion G protein-coupled receptor F5-like [Clarias gariepinus]|uniref:adhesion G protein-coupled receptor F5-like n=1 Tax=Clarias gariepinus TaxID=13013 RepID=UPI00234D82CE|nr:adhesion G protein-coupled receptor F5-like [Clarias gariepinus]
MTANITTNTPMAIIPVARTTGILTPKITTSTTSPAKTTAQTSTTSTTATHTTTTTTTIKAIITPTTTATTTSQDILVIYFSMKINQQFDTALVDKKSATFKKVTATIENSIDQSYKSVPGYQAKSATVQGFRPGSVIADFSINSTTDILDLLWANQQIASNLRLLGFNISNDAFSYSVASGLYKSSDQIYPGQNLKLTCNITVNNSIQWMWNGIELQGSDRYEIVQTVLTIKNITPDDSGQYECRTTKNLIPYVIWQRIIIPYPNIQVSNDKYVKCENSTVMLQCCVQNSYEVKWKPAACIQPSTVPPTGCILCGYKLNTQDCKNNEKIMVTCQLTKSDYNAQSITINVVNTKFTCYNNVFGPGNVEDVHVGDCNDGMVGYQKATCKSTGQWQITDNNCVLQEIQNLKDRVALLGTSDLPVFMTNLSMAAETNAQNISSSSSTILAIAGILQTIANISENILITTPVITGFLQTLDVIGSVAARGPWMNLNENSSTSNVSSELLKSVESISRRLPNENIVITTNFAHLKRLLINVSFVEAFGNESTTSINIPMISAQSFLTIIVFSALDNVLPVRTADSNAQTNFSISADIAVIEPTSKINNISFNFAIKNTTLRNPQCVFWNFSLLNGIGGWDSTGCQLKRLGDEAKRVTCECNHTTSFSILMSPFTPGKGLAVILDYITYIGVAISLASLVLCLIIEIFIWKVVTRNDTSYMRHVSVVNIALSLLIADICFIIGAAVVKEGEKTPEGPCSTATFFMHFFYLALFFWMFLSALLLLYRTLMVFSRMSRSAMMAIAFTVGYGAPLIIAVIAVASTAGNHGYVQDENSCWLNWDETKALLAFVIPALTIVALNFLVLIVVLCKMLRRGINASTQPDEKHPLLVIARCVGILTPLFGLTWGFGIGTLVSPDRGIHIVFAFLNSLQGFFILLFGTLLDNKVREALARKLALRNFSSNSTRSTSAGTSSPSRITLIQKFWRRDVYHIQESGILSSSSSNPYRVV